MPHPHACPYCGSTAVGGATLDGQCRWVLLLDDGTIQASADSDSAWDWKGEDLLYCYGCSSTYPIPADAVVRWEDWDGMRDQVLPQPPSKGEDGYIGNDVTWTIRPVDGEGRDLRTLDERLEAIFDELDSIVSDPRYDGDPVRAGLADLAACVAASSKAA